jgi:hypothetical protein
LGFNDAKIGDTVKVWKAGKEDIPIETKIISVKKGKIQVEYRRIWYEERHWNRLISDDEKKLRL